MLPQAEHPAETLHEAITRHRKARIAVERKHRLSAERRERAVKVIPPISEIEWALDQLAEFMSQKRFPTVQESHDLWDHAEHVGLDGLTVQPEEVDDEISIFDGDDEVHIVAVDHFYVGHHFDGVDADGCVCDGEIVDVDF